YWPHRRDDAAQVTFLVNIAAGVTWCVITLAAAPSIASFFHTPSGAPMMRAIALSFILKYLGNTHDALSQKDLRFRARFIPELSLALVKAAVSIGLALAGFGAWSLVWGHIAGVGIRTILLWLVVDWRPRLGIPRDLLKPMLAYGRGIIAVNVLAAITHHADLAVVGRMLGTTALGLYQLASRIPETTIVVLLSVVSSVLFPAFSRMHAGGASLREPYLEVTRTLAAAIFPLAAGLILLARPLILLFLGERWLGAVPILQALTACAAVRALGTHAGDLLKATGRPRLLARLAIVKAAIVLPALLFGARFGAAGVARALAIAAALGTAITLAAAARAVRLRLASILGASLPGIAGAAIMSVPLLAWMWWSAARLAPLVQLLGGTALGATVFAGALLLLDRELVRAMRDFFLPRLA
ncbi:MAG TPA: oligosaccharide flippase family protein, partial [Thermoanaerobaculia bacterium]|nr:oligosaccharide flippase family protein [Thermoanaerobaculia bacterium]